MATDLGLDTNTVRAHPKILEDLFLVRQLRPWHVNLGSRQVKSSKLHILETGLLASSQNLTGPRVLAAPLEPGAEPERLQ